MTTVTDESAGTEDVSSSMIAAETVGPGAQDLGDMLIWPVPNDVIRYLFLPKAPSLALTPDGRPQASLIEAGDIGFLTLSAEWTIPNARLEAVRNALEQSHGEAVQLSFASVEDVQAELHIGDAEPIVSRSTSGLPPYAAMFSTQVSGDAKTTVQAALAGQEGLIRIRYAATLSLPLDVEVRLFGQIDGAPSREVLTSALDTGRAAFEGADLPAELLAPLIDRAVLNLMTVNRPDESGEFSLTIAHSGQAAHPIVASADFGAGLAPQTLFNAVLPSLTTPQ